MQFVDSVKLEYFISNEGELNNFKKHGEIFMDNYIYGVNDWTILQ